MEATSPAWKVGGEARAGAREFFYSRGADYVHWRCVWFGLAGLPVPGPGDIEGCIRRLRGGRRNA